MASSIKTPEGVLGAAPDLDELAVINEYAKRESLSVEEAIADLLELAVAIVSSDMKDDDNEPASSCIANAIIPMLCIKYPQFGRYSELTAHERGFIANIVSESLTNSLQIVLAFRSLLEKPNELERSDK